MAEQPIPESVLLLEPSASAALDITGNGALELDASLAINSSSASAVRLTGNATVRAPEMDIVGGNQLTGNAVLQIDGLMHLAAALADPLRFLPEPNVASLTVQSAGALHFSKGANALSPGVYKGGFAIDGKASVHLDPGIYVLQGGGLQMAGQSKLQGDGVMLFLQNGASLQFSGQTEVALSPPTDGAYRGISIFQARQSSAGMQLTGNESWNLRGMVYAPNANVRLSGNGAIRMGSQLLSRTMTLTGNGTFQVYTDATLVPLGCPF